MFLNNRWDSAFFYYVGNIAGDISGITTYAAHTPTLTLFVSLSVSPSRALCLRGEKARKSTAKNLIGAADFLMTAAILTEVKVKKAQKKIIPAAFLSHSFP